MYSVLSYPLQVISTNRIAGSQIMKESGENLPKELMSLYERGEMKRGLFRGFVPTVLFGVFWGEVYHQS